MASNALRARAQLGATARRHPHDTERLADARRNLAAAKIEDYIRRVTESAPPLTQEQRDHLTRLLHPALSASRGPDAAA